MKIKYQRWKCSCRISRSGVNSLSNSPCTTNTYVQLIKTIFSKLQVHCISRTTNQSRYSFSWTVIGLVSPLRLAKSHDFVVSLLISWPTVKFRKLAPPSISPSKSKPPKLVTQKTHRINCPSKDKPPPPVGLYLEIALKYKVKQSKNGKFPSNYKASKIDFETQIFLCK